MADTDLAPLHQTVDAINTVLSKISSDGKVTLDTYLSSISANPKTRAEWYLEIVDLLLTELSRNGHLTFFGFMTF